MSAKMNREEMNTFFIHNQESPHAKMSEQRQMMKLDFSQRSEKRP